MLEELMGRLGMLPQVLEIISAGALVLGFVIVTGIWLFDSVRKGTRPALERYRPALGRVILIGLELLVAASIVKTVVFEPTLEGMGRLAALVAIRTIIGWTTVLEVSGCWPWQSAPHAASAAPERRSS